MGVLRGLVIVCTVIHKKPNFRCRIPSSIVEVRETSYSHYTYFILECHCSVVVLLVVYFAHLFAFHEIACECLSSPRKNECDTGESSPPSKIGSQLSLRSYLWARAAWNAHVTDEDV